MLGLAAVSSTVINAVLCLGDPDSVSKQEVAVRCQLLDRKTDVLGRYWLKMFSPPFQLSEYLGNWHLLSSL